MEWHADVGRVDVGTRREVQLAVSLSLSANAAVVNEPLALAAAVKRICFQSN